VNLTTRSSGFGVSMTAFDGDQHGDGDDGGRHGGRPVARS